MKSESIKRYSMDLAKEISQRKSYNLEEVQSLIEIRFNDALADFLIESSTIEEKRYLDLLDQQSKNKVGSKEYVSMGYKLSKAKFLKAASNRILTKISSEKNYQSLKKYIIESFGQESFDKFLQQSEIDVPIYSSDLK